MQSISKLSYIFLLLLAFAPLIGQTVKIRTEIIDYQKVFDPNTLFSGPVEHRNYQISDLGYSSDKVLIEFDVDLFEIGTDDWVNIAIEMDRPEYPVAKDLNEDGIPDFFQMENAFETEVNGTVRATWDAVDADYQGEKISIPAGFASFSLQGSRLSRTAGQSVVGIERTITLLEENMIEEYDWEVRSLADGIASIAISPVEAEGSISLDLDYGQYACSLNVVGDAIGNEIVLSGRGNLQWEEDRLTLSDFPLPSAGNPTLGQTHSFLSETSLPETITFEKKDNLYQALVTKENLRFWIEISEFDPTAPRMDLDSNSTESGTLWRTSSWFGSYWQGPLNWIFHSSMGWLYHGSTDELGSWLWNENLGWFWMTPEHETFAFLDSGNCWVFLDFSSYPSLTYDFIHEKWLPLSNYLHGKPDRIRRQVVEYTNYIQSAAEDANLTDEEWILNSLEAVGEVMKFLKEGGTISFLFEHLVYLWPGLADTFTMSSYDNAYADFMEYGISYEDYLRIIEHGFGRDVLRIEQEQFSKQALEVIGITRIGMTVKESLLSFGNVYPNLGDELNYLLQAKAFAQDSPYSSFLDGRLQYYEQQILYTEILERDEFQLFYQLTNDSNYREFNASREEIANFLGFSNDWSIANENDLPLFAWNLAKQISLPVETAASAHQLGLHFDLAKQALDQNVSLENAKLAQDADLPMDRAKEALSLNLEFIDAAIAIQENLSFENAKQAVDLDLSIPQARKALDAGISITEGKQAYTIGLTFDNAKLALDYNVTFANAKLAQEENLAIELVPAALAVNLSFSDAAEAIQRDLSFEQATEALDLQLSLSDAQNALQGGLSLVDAKEALDREISFSTAKQALDFLLPLARVKEAETENLSLSEAGEAHVIGLSFSFAHQALDLNLTFSDARDASVFGLNAEEAKIALHLGMSESEMVGHVVGGGTLQSLLEKEASDAGIEVNYFLEASLYDLNASRAREAYALGIGAKVAQSFDDLKAASFLIEGLSLGLKEEQMLEAMLYFSKSKDFQELIGFDWQIVIETINQGIEIKDIDW